MVSVRKIVPAPQPPPAGYNPSATTGKEDSPIFNIFGRGKSLSMSQAMDNIKSNPNIRLVDVRSPEEYRQGHIPGSLCVPLDDLGRISRLIPEKSDVIYAYCASGARSGMAVGMLKRMGYSDVINIGGIISYPGKLER